MQILSRWLLKNDKDCPIVALTSRLSGEGVSTVTNGLARSFSTMDTGKVLMLNASRKHPRKARVLDVTDSQEFSNLSEYVTSDKKSGFDILRVTNVPHNNFTNGETSVDSQVPVPDILFDDDGSILDDLYDSEVGSEQIRKLLRKLKKVYDIILVDAGSLSNSNGTSWLLNSDVNLLVIDCSRTTRESLEHQQREFENADISIDGSILNKRKFPIPNFLYWLVR